MPIMTVLCRKRLLTWLLLAGCVSALSAGVFSAGNSAEPQQSQRPLPTPLAIASLPNALRLNHSVISGGQPAGESGFQALQQLGVQTVISVDGATPDLELALKYGLRYVHMPHGYDGIPQQRLRELAKAVTELPGPIYVHCHHGKHRSPAAAVVACIGAGLMNRETGRRVLQLAGTSPDYQGLHDAVDQATRQQNLDNILVKYQAATAVPPLATAMVQIEHSLDRLKQVELAGWQTPQSHPDLSPAHEVLLLREHFTELLRTDDTQARPRPFRQFIERTIVQAAALEQALRQPNATSTIVARSRLSDSLAAIGRDCKQCHRDYRDRPRDRGLSDETVRNN
jgi:protein tyrosine phosphatase (PTP) superfamily phosphohydrolase (DUF442 family)